MKIIDVETTGLNIEDDDRIVSIAALDILNETFFYSYVNPQRGSSPEALKIHSLDEKFLSDKPLFVDIADQFLKFIGDDTLIAHNAQFDISAINTELHRCGKNKLTNFTIDTLNLARDKFPGQRYSLDKLCEKFGIDRQIRDVKHDALHDCRLTKEIYLKLT